jgi:hypothetical protein
VCVCLRERRCTQLRHGYLDGVATATKHQQRDAKALGEADSLAVPANRQIEPPQSIALQAAAHKCQGEQQAKKSRRATKKQQLCLENETTKTKHNPHQSAWRPSAAGMMTHRTTGAQITRE